MFPVAYLGTNSSMISEIISPSMLFQNTLSTLSQPCRLCRHLTVTHAAFHFSVDIAQSPSL